MSRRRGRPARQYRVWARTVRREPIDYAALAQAALEQAALNQHNNGTAFEAEQHPSLRSSDSNGDPEVGDDRLA